MNASHTVVFVGGGPRTLGILERIAANLPDLAPDARLEIHVVDPHPPGGGRIWRSAQSPLLWMNSEAQDITVFTDGSVTCDGPAAPGPSLATWAAGHEGSSAAAKVTPRTFAPRVVQADYLGWVWQQVVDRMPQGVVVHGHRGRAVGLTDAGNSQRVVVERDGRRGTLHADTVVLAQGYLDQRPRPDEQALLQRAAAAGLGYVPAGHTADLDLDGIPAGEPVIVRGMGLAFVDLAVLLGEGRGGTFTGDGHELTYHPSGREPVLHVGSRRGVPYHAKLGYEIRRPGDGPAPLTHFTRDRFAAIGDGTSALDYRSQVWPLIVIELAVAHYRRLFSAHAERTRGTFERLERALLSADAAGPDLAEAARPQLTDPEDLFDITRIDRPLTALVDDRTSATDVQAHVADHVRRDLARRGDPSRSSDRAVFDTLLGVYAVLSELVVSGRIGDEDRVRHVEGHFHGLFSFLASGPPPPRLAQLLALHRAGIVRFIGPDVTLAIEDGHFVARSGHREVRARTAVEARLPSPDSSLVTDPLVAGLLATGELRSLPVTAADGTPLGGGRLVADGRARAVRADGSAHPRRFLLGPAVSGSAGAGGFSRPGFNGPGLRQNDAVARELIAAAIGDAGRGQADTGPRPAPTTVPRTTTTRATTTRATTTTDKEHRHAS